MKDLQILSTFQELSPEPSGPASKGTLLFDVCHIGLALRAVLFVELVLAAAAMFGAPTLIDWLSRLSIFTGGALPATLVWLIVTCGLKRVLALVLRERSKTPVETKARLSELQSRIRPHFLFNTLNTAIALVRAEPAKAEALLEDLSDLFRHALREQGASVSLAAAYSPQCPGGTACRTCAGEAARCPGRWGLGSTPAWH